MYKNYSWIGTNKTGKLDRMPFGKRTPYGYAYSCNILKVLLENPTKDHLGNVCKIIAVYKDKEEILWDEIYKIEYLATDKNDTIIYNTKYDVVFINLSLPLSLELLEHLDDQEALTLFKYLVGERSLEYLINKESISYKFTCPSCGKIILASPQK